MFGLVMHILTRPNSQALAADPHSSKNGMRARDVVVVLAAISNLCVNSVLSSRLHGYPVTTLVFARLRRERARIRAKM